MKVERKVQEFINKQQLFAEDAKVLVALSGGADSVALLRMLVQLGYHCHAVHCNFHLRGEESCRDEQFSMEICRALHVDIEVLHFDTQEYAEEHKLSIEMAARELRYREFERIRNEKSLDVIAVAHHQDDAVETFILNLVRGAGINGLTGMRVKNGHVVRPLLCLTRDEVLEYLDKLQQPYVTDSTNLTDMYARNKVRLNVLPMLQQINSAAKENIAQTAIHLSEAAIIYNRAMNEASKQMTTICDDGFDINIASLLETDVPQAHLFEMLKPCGFNSSQVADIFRALSAEAGRTFHTSTHTALADRTHLRIRATKNEEEIGTAQYTLPEEGIMTLPDGTQLIVSHIATDEEWRVPKCNDKVYIDEKDICGPLTIRHPREGDRFKPFGMKGYKLLSDFYTDLKMPRTEKPRQWLLCHGNDIVWTVGLRSSEQYRVREGAKRVICIKAKK